jgi:hypothetical protein
LRGDDLETVSRSLGVTAATLSGWHDVVGRRREAILRANLQRVKNCRATG